MGCGRVLDPGMSRRDLVQRGGGLGRGPDLDDRHRGQRRQRAEQRDLVPAERPARPVRGEQHADEVPVDDQRRAADRDQPLLPHRVVDRLGVAEPPVGRVIRRPVRLPGLRHQPAEPGTERQPQLLERRRHRPVGGPHVRVALRRVVQGQVRDVGPDQRPCPMHDRIEYAAWVPCRGELPGHVDERGQPGLPALAGIQGGPDPQRHISQLPDLGHPGQLGRRCIVGQQPQQLQSRLIHTGDDATTHTTRSGPHGEGRTTTRVIGVLPAPGPATSPGQSRGRSSCTTVGCKRCSAGPPPRGIAGRASRCRACGPSARC
jgi:hypothetical protein